ncbi:MAG: hypothetical protein WAV28_11070 [Sedimentisphaerales bacterium]
MLTDSTAAHMKWQWPCRNPFKKGSGCYPPVLGDENTNVLLLGKGGKYV